MTFVIINAMKAEGLATYLVKPIHDIASIAAENPDLLLMTSFPAALYPPGIDWIINGADYEVAWVASGRPAPPAPRLLHANFQVGHEQKRDALVNHGAWLVDDEKLEEAMREFREESEREHELLRMGMGEPTRRPVRAKTKQDWRQFCKARDVSHEVAWTQYNR